MITSNVLPNSKGKNTDELNISKKNVKSLFKVLVSTFITNFLFFLRKVSNAVKPTRKNASVLNIKGAPSIAPTPISLAVSLAPKNIATAGNIVSGNAVPTAAKMLPTTACDILNLRPKTSILLVKPSAESNIMNKLTINKNIDKIIMSDYVVSKRSNTIP